MPYPEPVTPDVSGVEPTSDAAHFAQVADQRRSAKRFVPFGAMFVSVIVAGLLPFLGDRRFYLADDNVSSWMPTSRRIGELLLDGRSHLMDPEMWWSGNFVASARYGIWNPLIVALDVTALQMDDFAAAMLIVTLIYLLILASGTYLLACEYGADRWPAALAGLVVSTGGWTLWMDATWWTPQLTSMAFTPFFWLAARRLARGVGSPIWLLLAGWMLVTAGNPYSNIVVFVIIVAVGVECFDRRNAQNRRNVIALAASLVSIALVALFVYLPFRITAPVGWREAGIENNEWWSPGLGDLFLLSSPTATPFVPHFGRDILKFPAAYLSWFVLPLAPWLAWRTVRRRSVVGLAIFCAVFVLLALGPSSFWLFRWPFRLVPYVYLPIAIGFAVLLSAPLRSDRRARLATITAGIIAVGAYLAWAEVPTNTWGHVAAAVFAGIALTGVILAEAKLPGTIGPVLMVGTLAVLGVQLQLHALNGSVSDLALPLNASFYEENFTERYEGTVIQIAAYDKIAPQDRNLGGAYSDVTIGSMSAAAGLDGLNTYSGIGFSAFSDALCMRFDGAMCADAWERLWKVDDAGTTTSTTSNTSATSATTTSSPLADLLGIDTVVVQRTVLDTAEADAPPGWQIQEITDHVVVWIRSEAKPWPQSRLSATDGPVVIDSVEPAEAHRETVVVSRHDPGVATLTFARLAWPGYEASIDGRPLTIGSGTAGLLTVELPNDVDGGTITLTWWPPNWRRVLAVLVLGLLVGIATDIGWRRQRRGTL